MPSKIVDDARVYAGGFDFSGDSNQLALTISVEDVVMTPFGFGGGTKRRAGLTDASFSMQGFVDSVAAAQDESMFGSVLGVNNQPITVSDPAGSSQAVGDPSTFGRGVMLGYSPGAAVGEAHAFDASGMISGIVLPGARILHPDTSRTVSGTATGFQMGAVAAGEVFYSAVHILAAAGTTPTLDVVIESGTTNTFGTVADRVTFAQATAVGSQWGVPVAGSVTHQFWRVKYTIAGTTPAFTFVVVAGIK